MVYQMASEAPIVHGSISVNTLTVGNDTYTGTISVNTLTVGNDTFTGTISVNTLTVGNDTCTAIDSFLNATSSNPIRNSVIHQALSTKQDTISGNVVTSTDINVQVPAQGAHAGAALTTDGSSLSWKTVDTVVTTASTNLVTSDAVKTAINALVDGAPEALNTLNELSAALNDNPAVVTDILTAQGVMQTQVNAVRQVPDPASATDASVLTVDSNTPDGIVWAAPNTYDENNKLNGDFIDVVGTPGTPSYTIPATGFQHGYSAAGVLTQNSYSLGAITQGGTVQGIEFSSDWSHSNIIGLQRIQQVHGFNAPSIMDIDYLMYSNSSYDDSISVRGKTNGMYGNETYNAIPGVLINPVRDGVYQIRINAQEYVELVKDGTVIFTFGVDDNSAKAWSSTHAGGTPAQYYVTIGQTPDTWFNFKWVDSAGAQVGSDWGSPAPQSFVNAIPQVMVTLTDRLNTSYDKGQIDTFLAQKEDPLTFENAAPSGTGSITRSYNTVTYTPPDIDAAIATASTNASTALAASSTANTNASAALADASTANTNALAALAATSPTAFAANFATAMAAYQLANAGPPDPTQYPILHYGPSTETWGGNTYNYKETADTLYIYETTAGLVHEHYIAYNTVTKLWEDHGSSHPTSVTQVGDNVTIGSPPNYPILLTFTDPFYGL